MKKTIIALVAVTLAMPAYADHPTIRGEYLNHEFETRGECESTLKRERNERRQAGGDHSDHSVTGEDRTTSEYNHVVRETLECERNPNGSYSIVLR